MPADTSSATATNRHIPSQTLSTTTRLEAGHCDAEKPEMPQQNENRPIGADIRCMGPMIDLEKGSRSKLTPAHWCGTSMLTLEIQPQAVVHDLPQVIRVLPETSQHSAGAQGQYTEIRRS